MKITRLPARLPFSVGKIRAPTKPGSLGRERTISAERRTHSVMAAVFSGVPRVVVVDRPAPPHGAEITLGRSEAFIHIVMIHLLLKRRTGAEEF